MNLEKVVFGFFVILSCTLNFGFFIGDIDRPELHHPGELFAAVVVNLIALVLKFGDRTHIGATHLATSLAACLQLLAASLVWTWDAWVLKEVMDGGTMATIVSLSAGALVANLISVVLLIGETLRSSR
jgi:Ca2+/H+ antiporter, TMEM165/GDT1 family